MRPEMKSTSPLIRAAQKLVRIIYPNRMKFRGKSSVQRESSSVSATIRKGKDIPPEDHVVRYVKLSMIGENNTVMGAEFCLRPGETGLSVNWLEAFCGSKMDQPAKVRQLNMYRLTIKKNGRYAELNVGEVSRMVSEELGTLRIVHDPIDAERETEAD